MKAIAIVGSPRASGNTMLLARHTLRAVAEEGLETEVIRLFDYNIQPCDACLLCQDEEWCPIEDDLLTLYNRVKGADALILASPVYYGSATAGIKAFMERVGYIGGRKGVFARKVGGPLVVARRAGQNFTFAQLLLWFHILGFYMPGSTYWNIAFGRDEGEVEQDEEGMRTAWNFGKNLAHLVKKLRA